MPAVNEAIIQHLLEVGQGVTAAKNIDVPSLMTGPLGTIKILSTRVTTP